MNLSKLYNEKKPSHPELSHTKSKRWFKKKSHKRIRKKLKNFRNEREE